jgi:Zn-dependent protease with chaperone function
LIYLSEEEEAEIVEAEIKSLLEAQSGLIAPKDSEIVRWLQTIVDNLAVTAVDDIRDPVRRYSDDDTNNQQNKQIQIIPQMPPSGEVEVMEQEEEYTPAIPKRNFEVNVIWDKTTVNAMCAGSHILVYDLMMHYMDYNTNHMAVILSHEIAHSLQRHFVEQHGFASLMFMLGDITRGVFWMITESLGPYVNQKINDYIATFITLETQTTYNRKLEKEASESNKRSAIDSVLI